MHRAASRRTGHRLCLCLPLSYNIAIYRSRTREYSCLCPFEHSCASDTPYNLHLRPPVTAPRSWGSVLGALREPFLGRSRTHVAWLRGVGLVGLVRSIMLLAQVGGGGAVIPQITVGRASVSACFGYRSKWGYGAAACCLRPCSAHVLHIHGYGGAGRRKHLVRNSDLRQGPSCCTLSLNGHT